MRLKDAIGTLQTGREKNRKKTALRTVWSCPEDMADACPLPEYPRPQLVRSSWTNLNGWWDYAIVPAGEAFRKPEGRILVPFPPEADRSGVGRVRQPKETLWYAREFECPAHDGGQRVILHFGAVDERCAVFVNGKKAGVHRNGYLSFSFDITALLKTGSNELRVCVRDDSDAGTECRGKQRLAPGGMFYQAQSGIWQTVWLETVPENYITNLTVVPRADLRTVGILLEMKRPADVVVRIGGCADAVRLSAEEFRTGSGAASARKEVVIDSPRLWTPESPALYDLKIDAGEDQVRSYFAMRYFGKGTDRAGHPCLTLNGRPYFFNGILDQGYWPESLLTAPSDEALIFDIIEMKRLGFNMIRKHEKIEAERWYCHCDRLGMVVWQDMVHGGRRINSLLMTYLPTLVPWIRTHLPDRMHPLFGRAEADSRARFEADLLRMIRQLKNHPCIGLWNLFNEGWGQFDALRLEVAVKREDPDRMTDHASGWFDQGGGDVKSEHNYFRKLVVEKDPRPFVLSEYGGFSCRIAGHCMFGENYGYHDYAEKDFPDAFRRLAGEIEALKADGLAAAVYTQVSDVEEETNGLYTYDRKVCKVTDVG